MVVPAANRRVPLTELAWAVLAVGLGAGVLGLTFRWVELVVVAVSCVLAMVTSVLLTVGRMKIEVEQRISPRELTAGDPVELELLLTNRGGRTRRGLQVETVVGETVVPLRVPPMAAGATHTATRRLPALRRGIYQVGPARLVRTDPLGLISRQRPYGDQIQLRVWPQRQAVAATASGRSRDLDGPTSDVTLEGGSAFHALRDYAEGDDHRLIDWRATARTGGTVLKVRQYVDNRAPVEVVLLDNGGVFDDDGFELAVQVVASIVDHLGPSTLTTVFLTADGKPKASTGRSEALDRMAEVMRSPEPVLATLVRQAKEAADRSVLVTVVTGRDELDHLLPLVDQLPARRIELLRVGAADDDGAGRVWRRVHIGVVHSLNELPSWRRHSTRRR